MRVLRKLILIDSDLVFVSNEVEWWWPLDSQMMMCILSKEKFDCSLVHLTRRLASSHS